MNTSERFALLVPYIELDMRAREHKQDSLANSNVYEVREWEIFTTRLRMLVDEIVVPRLDRKKATDLTEGVHPS